LDVSESFFNKIWDEHKTDDSWRAWVCLDQSKQIIGCIVLQTFVHDSNYFRWGPPLEGKTMKPKKSGAFDDIVEISFFCAKGCGSLLLEHILTWVAESTQYKWIVMNSTLGAKSWYMKRGFKKVAAYRLPKMVRINEHLYRHRIPDNQFDPNQDPPSIMLYKPILRASNHPHH